MISKLKKLILIIAVAALCVFTGVAFVACSGDEWGAWKEIKHATCTEPGERIRYKTDNKAVFEREEIPALGHDWGEWHIITPSTHTSEGLKDRTCKRCAEEDVDDIPMLPTTYYIDIVDADGNRIDRVYTDDDGAYELTAPTLVGYEFIRFITEDGEDFAVSGVVDASIADGKKVTVVADFEVLPTTTFAQLYERAEAGAKKILIAADITMTGSVYIVGNTEITTDKACTLTRGADFGGDMFIVGETEDGENTVLSGKPSSLTLSATGGTLTVDGNKSGMTDGVEVSGTAILVLNSATVTMNDGVTLKDCKKTANSKLLNSDYKISYVERIGGAAMIVVNGTFVMNGGTFDGNEVNIDETGSDTVGDGDEKDESNRASSCGGAIYANADITINGGTFSENSAARGGAVYSYRKTYVNAATFINNTAGVYAGAIYLPGSQYSAVYLGKEDAEADTVLLEGNTAEKSGGAMFGQMKNSITIYGGTTFKNNVAVASNGGAINTSGAVTIFDAKFEGNRAASKGGAIYMYYANEDLTVRNVEIFGGVFDGNKATKGGAIAFSSSDPDFETGAVGVIGKETVQPISEEDSEEPTEGEEDTQEHVYDVIFKNNSALATETEDPELPDADQDKGDDEEGSESVVKAYNGNGGAIYISRRANVTLFNVLFESNSSERKGGAIYITSDGAELVDNGSGYTENTAGSNGGAIYAYTDTKVTIDGSTFTSNSSNDEKYGGGAVYFSGAKNSAISNSKFIGNSAVYNGGAIGVYSGTKLTLTDNIFGGKTSEEGNTAGNHAGAVYIASNGTVVTDNGSSYSYNTAGNHGGAIFAGSNTVLKINGSSFSNNEATKNAGAIYAYTDSTLEVNESSFTANKSHGTSYGGGAMYISGATVNMDTVAFTDNAADNKFGGAICAYSSSTVTIKNITTSGNTCKSRGKVLTVGSAGTVVNILGGSLSESGAVMYCGKSTTVNINVDHLEYPNGSVSEEDGCTVNYINDEA